MSEFIDYLEEVFSEFGPVSARRMFGGHGVFHEGLMIGLVAHDNLYLKVDEHSAPAFEARHLHRFEYQKKGKTVYLSYRLAPEEALDDAQEMQRWAELAYAAALRARK